MADSTVSALAIFDNGTDLNYLEKDGEILFTAEEIGKHLGYGEPARSVSNLFNRNRNELKLYSSVIKVMNGNQFNEIRVFTEEGVYILSMLSRTNEAKKFRARVALLLRRVRHEAVKRQIELAREAALLELGQARAAAARQALDLTPLDRVRIKKILGYRQRGFSCREIAAVMGFNQRRIGHLVSLSKKLGLGGAAPTGV